VPLAPLREPGLVVSAIAQHLDIKEGGRQPLIERVKIALRERQMVLTLDNFEHLAAAAGTVAELLADCPDLKIVVTSRAPLHIYGEHQFPVPPVEVPDLEQFAPVEALSRVPAVALFIERARAIRPNFALTSEIAATIAEVCVRLEGVPLALELGAARIKLLPPKEILARIGSRLALLSGGAIDRPARHQTIRAAIAWSHDLLSAQEQHLLRRLAVFDGGWTLEAAEAICDGSVAEPGLRPSDRTFSAPLVPHDSILDGISSLLDQSLVREMDQTDGGPRFTMLETIREYGLERLTASGEALELRRRHASFFLALAERAEALLHGPEQIDWMARLEAEHANMRAALTWSQAPDGNAAEGLRLASALAGFWEVRGHLTEGRRWLEAGLARVAKPSPVVAAKALVEAGRLAYRQGDLGRAKELLEIAVGRYRALQDRPGLAFALSILSRVSANRGAFPTSRVQAEEAVTVARGSGDRWIFADALYSLGGNQLHAGENAEARASFEAALALDRELGDRQHASRVLAYASRAALRQGDPATARRLQEESLAIKRAVGDRRGAGSSHLYLAEVAREQGDYAQARSHLRESVTILSRLGDQWTLIEALDSCAQLEATEGQAEWAVKLFAVAEARREGMGGAVRVAERAEHERAIASLRVILGPEAFAAAWASGRALTIWQAVEHARSSGSPARSKRRQAMVTQDGSPAGRGLVLSPREREVAALVARGLTDPQIAAMLVIGTRTAETHVANCLSKLGFATRTQLAAWAVQHGLAMAHPLE
jgi:non-specific serine/threonine protein kinase